MPPWHVNLRPTCQKHVAMSSGPGKRPTAASILVSTSAQTTS